MKKRRKKGFVLLITGLLCLCAGILIIVCDQRKESAFGVLNDELLLQIPYEELPEDALYITEGRRLYQRGKMTLIIPSIDVYTPVGESTVADGLKEMPGLYEFSQLPAPGDVNVSIAGHRDIYDMVFYCLDQIQSGDYLYLLYDGLVYRYLYQDTVIVAPDEWSVIRPQGYSCLTLTTCDPIGTALRRMIVTGELMDYQLFDAQYQFISNNATSP